LAGIAEEQIAAGVLGRWGPASERSLLAWRNEGRMRWRIDISSKTFGSAMRLVVLAPRAQPLQKYLLFIIYLCHVLHLFSFYIFYGYALINLWQRKCAYSVVRMVHEASGGGVTMVIMIAVKPTPTMNHRGPGWRRRTM
jgi:hypothetical protein